MLITDYFQEVRETIVACDIVYSSNVTYDQRTDYVGFIRGEVYLDEGDVLTLVDLGDAFFLSPKVSVVPKLAAEIERLGEEAGLSVEDLLDGLDEQRRCYFRGR